MPGGPKNDRHLLERAAHAQQGREEAAGRQLGPRARAPEDQRRSLWEALRHEAQCIVGVLQREGRLGLGKALDAHGDAAAVDVHGAHVEEQQAFEGKEKEGELGMKVVESEMERRSSDMELFSRCLNWFLKVLEVRLRVDASKRGSRPP